MNKLKTLITAVAVSAGLLHLPDLSAAQNTNPDTNSNSGIDTSRVYTLDEIIVSASRYEEDPASVGRNVTVINRQEIEQSLHFSVAELLSEQQSLYMVGGGQTPGSLQQGFLRSSNSRHSVVMIDGIRISDPSTVNNSVDLSELSLLGIERIEIVRGSHSTLYGSSAIGGVINIITQDRAAGGFNGDLSTRHGIFGSGTYATQNNVIANYTLENGLYIDGGVHQQLSNGLDATIDTVASGGTFNPQDRDHFLKLDLLGKVGYKTPDTDIYLSYRNEDQNSDVDQGAFNDDDNAKVNFNRGLLAYGAGHQFSNFVELNFEGAYSSLNRDFVNDSSVVDAQGNYDGTYVETNAEGTSWENSLTATLSGNNFRAIAGLESSTQTMTSRNYVFSRSSFGVFEQTTDLDSLDLKEQIHSAFVHTELSGGVLAESLEPFSLVLGGRLADHNEFGTHLTYEVNPKVRISSSAMIYGAFTTGFHAPSLYQLNTPEQDFGAFTSRGNPNLRPEESISYELGWKQEAGNLLDFELSLFRTEVKDVIEYIYLWNGSTPTEDLSSADYLGDTYINVSQQEISGLEFGMNLQPFSSLTFGGSISIAESRLKFLPGDIDKDYTGGNHVQIFESGEFVNEEKELEGLTRRPEFSAMIRAAYQPLPGLHFHVTSQFVGSRDDVFYSASLGPFGAQDRSKVDGYNITDLRVGYDFTNRFSVSGKVENIFDSRYVEIDGFKTRGRGFLVKLHYRLRS